MKVIVRSLLKFYRESIEDGMELGKHLNQIFYSIIFCPIILLCSYCWSPELVKPRERRTCLKYMSYFALAVWTFFYTILMYYYISMDSFGAVFLAYSCLIANEILLALILKLSGKKTETYLFYYLMGCSIISLLILFNSVWDSVWNDNP